MLNFVPSEKHPLLIWTSLSPGDRVVIKGSNSRQHVGTVLTGTKDGLVIWIRTDLNERKMFHFHDCQFVHVVNPTIRPP